jgi:hypothetical protein
MQRTLIVIVTILFFSGVSSASSEIVPIEAARIVATERLADFYAGSWDLLFDRTYYDLDGVPSAYAFTFGKQSLTQGASTEAAIRASVHRLSNECDELEQRIDAIQQIEDVAGKEKNRLATQVLAELRQTKQELVGKGDYVTLTTGAQTDEVVIIKCHEGLPEYFLAEPLFRKTLAPNGEQLPEQLVHRVIYLGPFDLFLEPAANTRGAVESHASVASDGALSPETVLYHLRTNREVLVKELRSAGGIASQTEPQEPPTKQKATSDGAGAEERKARNEMMWAAYIRRTQNKSADGRQPTDMTRDEPTDVPQPASDIEPTTEESVPVRKD